MKIIYLVVFLAILSGKTQAGWDATATHYSPAQGGSAICGSEGGYCGAVSDGAAFWVGDICRCDSPDETCSQGYCFDCWNQNLCQSGCPHCPTDICGKRFKITCRDDGSGYCRGDGACVVISVTNACPQYNPCNTCKGGSNRCTAGVNHIDLCDSSYDHIAYTEKQPADGIHIYVEETYDPEGDCYREQVNENPTYK